MTISGFHNLISNNTKSRPGQTLLEARWWERSGSQGVSHKEKSQLSHIDDKPLENILASLSTEVKQWRLKHHALARGFSMLARPFCFHPRIRSIRQWAQQQQQIKHSPDELLINKSFEQSNFHQQRIKQEYDHSSRETPRRHSWPTVPTTRISSNTIGSRGVIREDMITFAIFFMHSNRRFSHLSSLLTSPW